MLRRALLLLLLASPAHASSFAPGSFDLDATVTRAMQAFDVPGVAVAIVKDGRVVVAKGWGVRKAGTAPALVDGDTLFGIASNTKAFTTAALAILVEEKKIAWDDRVVKYLPSFAMNDPWVTREMTIRDLVTHRSGLGLGEGDLLWWPGTDYSRDEIVRRLRFLRPATGFRSRYAYDNVLYLVAGQVVAAASGKSWDDFVRERIFSPLAMTSTRTSITNVPADANLAMPHVVLDGHPRPVAYLHIDNVAPCVGIVSSAADMAKWMIALLEKPPAEVWSPQTIVPNPELPKPLAPLQPLFQAYGLGWYLRDYRGHLVATHTGALLGMTSRVLLVPDRKLGIVVLTNQESRGAFDAIAWAAADAYLDAPATDWVGPMKLVETAQEKALPDAAAARGDRPLTLPIARYAGRLRDAWYGDAVITLEGGRLVMRFTHTPALVGDLERWDADTFLVRWRDRTLNADALATFTVGKKEAVERLRMNAASPLTDFSFDFQDLDFVPLRK